MRAGLLALMLLPALAGCGEPVEDGPRHGKADGRYAGIGVFAVGELWAEIAGAAQPKEAATARLADDEHIIVVVDSRTGEVRQCGDHSGYCVAMNPWSGPAGLRGTVPVALARHAADLARERDEQTATEAAAPKSARAAQPAR
jgi:hypothetical protein